MTHLSSQTKEFADRMRLTILTYMPALSSRIHRLVDPGDITESPSVHPPPRIDIKDSVQHTEWAWPDAEKRLQAAFERDGFSGWAEAALREIEAEGQSERMKRGPA